MIINVYDLDPRYEACKSYYGKAKVLYHDNGDMELQSYDTIVSRYTKAENKLVNFGKYSQTTTRHQKEFTKQILGPEAAFVIG